MKSVEKKTLTEQFNDWLELNPSFFPIFEQHTFDLINAGVTKSSAWLVANRIRWEVLIKTYGNEYKISNDFIALLARKFMADHPKHQGFFTVKEMKRA
ncbi:hypothetical protein D3C80_435320 [compost metagenome]